MPIDVIHCILRYPLYRNHCLNKEASDKKWFRSITSFCMKKTKVIWLEIKWLIFSRNVSGGKKYWPNSFLWCVLYVAADFSRKSVKACGKSLQINLETRWARISYVFPFFPTLLSLLCTLSIKVSLISVRLCEDYRVVVLCLRYVILCIQADTSYYKIEETRVEYVEVGITWLIHHLLKSKGMMRRIATRARALPEMHIQKQITVIRY